MADGPDSIVRYIRVAPMSVDCSRRTVVQAAEVRVRNASPAQLVKSNNPCAVRPADLNAALKKYKWKASVFETISFGVVVRCGASSVTLELPMAEKVQLDRMQQDRPEIARLWSLAADITDPVFGSKDIFHDRTEEDDVVLQRAGEKLIAELSSGRFDAGLAAAVKGNVGTWRSPSFRSLLEDYRGPVSASEANASITPQLVNAQTYRFSSFVAPKYPPIARSARVQGRVELQLTLEPATGEVLNALAVSGSGLLAKSVIEAAKQWRFAPDSVESGSLNVTLEFAIRCP